MDWKGNPSPRAWWHSFGFNEKVNPTPTPIPKPKPKPKPKPNPNPNPNSIPNPNQEGWREEGFSVAFAPEERQYARQYMQKLAYKYRQAAIEIDTQLSLSLSL